VKLAPPEPFSLKIEKTGPATCKPGSECAFDLTLTNTGKDHTGAVTLTDGLSDADSMSIVSIAPPLPCATQPAEIPFNCRTADNFTLPAGDKRTFRVTARVPRSAGTSFTNCAILASARAPRSGGTSDSALTSCATVKTSEPQGEKPECKGGMILLDEGVCACPAGTTWNGRACATTTPTGGGGVTTPTPCPPERPIGTFPNCCPRGTRFKDGACRSDVVLPPPPPVCEGARPIGTFPNCCPRGTRFKDGACRSDVVPPPPPPVCEGARPVGTFPNCCPRGTRFKDGACRSDVVPPPPPPVCEGARPIGTFPNCCPRGTQFKDGACRRDVIEKDGQGDGGTNLNSGGDDDCPRSAPVGKQPHCCPRNSHFERGACRPDVTPPPPVCKGERPVGTFPNCCPRGTRFKDGACRRDDKKGDGDGGTQGNTNPCPAGSFGKFPNCRCPLGTTGSPPNCCPPGTRSENGKCIRPQPTGKCTGGRIGTPPNNCKCPPGTHWARSQRCVEDASPKPKPTPTPPPPPPKCPSNKPFGSPPNCCGGNDWNPRTQRCEKFQGPK
jgi:hypothetical protein